jgi:hypothetical protein
MNTMAGEYLAMKDSLAHHATMMENIQVSVFLKIVSLLVVM